MNRKRKNLNLQDFSYFDLYLILFYAIWLHTRRPALPAPVHFSLVASLCMFALLPIMPHHPLAIPTVIGAGISFALLLQGGNKQCPKNKRSI